MAAGLAALLAGSYRLEERMMLQVEHWRGERAAGQLDRCSTRWWFAAGSFVRPISCRHSVDGYLLATYMADGLIASTPTGSTAYALAAGGPIMPPELRNILIIPVAPHLSVDRAIILSRGRQRAPDVLNTTTRLSSASTGSAQWCWRRGPGTGRQPPKTWYPSSAFKTQATSTAT